MGQCSESMSIQESGLAMANGCLVPMTHPCSVPILRQQYIATANAQEEVIMVDSCEGAADD